MSNCDVLIVGAGPTGLVMALRLAGHGIAFRIIDRNSGPGQASRAMALHARTLEFYDQSGFADEVVNRGIEISRLHVRESAKERATIAFSDLGGALSPYPFVLCFPQDDHERFLVDRLSAMGINVEWNTTLAGLSPQGEEASAKPATASLVGPRGSETVSARFVCGCDGAHSQVRHSLGLDFAGGTYEQLFYVADVKLATDTPEDLFMNLDEGGFALMLPVRSSGMRRLIGTIPAALQTPDVGFEALRAWTESVMGFKVAELNWYSTYRVHHRVASHFRKGSVFVAGDAGHLHSPAGGQGMNTGIGDAVNLSWKLANVIQGRTGAEILDSYEPERIAFARKLVATTDRAFQSIVNPGIGGKFLRSWLIPQLAPAATDLEMIRRLIFKTISQIRINYRDSSISAGRAGELRGGDRLPWVADAEGGNFASLRSLDWQCHVYGTPTPQLEAAAVARRLAVTSLPFGPAASKAGLVKDAAYLIRPDGHIALALPHQDGDALHAYAGRIGLR